MTQEIRFEWSEERPSQNGGTVTFIVVAEPRDEDWAFFEKEAGEHRWYDVPVSEALIAKTNAMKAAMSDPPPTGSATGLRETPYCDAGHGNKSRYKAGHVGGDRTFQIPRPETERNTGRNPWSPRGGVKKGRLASDTRLSPIVVPAVLGDLRQLPRSHLPVKRHLPGLVTDSGDEGGRDDGDDDGPDRCQKTR